MADIDKAPPVDGGNPPTNPPKDNDIDDKNIDTESLKINEIIQQQIGAFQDSFMEKFNEEYQNKLSKLQTSQKELDEKKQRLAVLDELKAAKMDSSLIDYVYDKDIEVSKVKIKQLSGLIAEEVQRGIEDRIRKSSYIPPKGTDDTKFTNSIKKPKYVV